MMMDPTVREFPGYYVDASKKFPATFLPGVEQRPESDAKAAEQFSGATPFTSATPLPIFRLRQVSASAVVWDGQTVVLGPGSVEVEDKSQRDAAGAAKKSRKSRGDARALSKKKRKHPLVFFTPARCCITGKRVQS